MNFIPSLKPISVIGLGHNLGGVECNYQSSTYGNNPASAALETGAAFLLCIPTSGKSNLLINTAMLKNDSIMPGAYVSPAVRVAQLHSRRVVCVSLGAGYGNGKSSDLWNSGGEGVNDYSGDDDLL